MISEVIGFRGRHFDNAMLKRGRMFYDTGFTKMESGRTSQKSSLHGPEGFSETKSTLYFDRELDAYVGPRLREWRGNGGIVVLQSSRGHPHGHGVKSARPFVVATAGVR